MSFTSNQGHWMESDNNVKSEITSKPTIQRTMMNISGYLSLDLFLYIDENRGRDFFLNKNGTTL